jgi:RNA polymerase sigma-70 factor (ECF subfamily)
VSDLEPAAGEPPNEQDHAAQLLALYDEALPQVYGYLVRRCPTATLAEDLTSETFMAAVGSIDRGAVRTVTVAWLVTIARNKLVDHWRRHEREQRGLQLVHSVTATEQVDEWADVDELDLGRALAVLHTLGPHHQAALSLRYLDGLSVRNVADQLGRTEHATEALLVRARTAFRKAYEEAQDRDRDGGRETDDH